MEIKMFNTLAEVEEAARTNYEGTTDIMAMHDALVAVVCDASGFTYYEGYSMGGEMIVCNRDRAEELINCY